MTVLKQTTGSLLESNTYSFFGRITSNKITFSHPFQTLNKKHSAALNKSQVVKAPIASDRLCAGVAATGSRKTASLASKSLACRVRPRTEICPMGEVDAFLGGFPFKTTVSHSFAMCLCSLSVPNSYFDNPKFACISCIQLPKLSLCEANAAVKPTQRETLI